MREGGGGGGVWVCVRGGLLQTGEFLTKVRCAVDEAIFERYATHFIN